MTDQERGIVVVLGIGLAILGFNVLSDHGGTMYAIIILICVIGITIVYSILASAWRDKNGK
jgi:hypothetical protein